MNSVISELQTKLNKGNKVDGSNIQTAAAQNDGISVSNFKDEVNISISKLYNHQKLRAWWMIAVCLKYSFILSMF